MSSETSDILSNILRYILTGVLIATVVLGIMMLLQISRLATIGQYYTSYTTAYGPWLFRVFVEGGS